MKCQRILTSDTGGLMLVVDPAGLAAKVQQAASSDSARSKVVTDLMSASMQMSREGAAAARDSKAAAETAGTMLLKAEEAYKAGDGAMARKYSDAGRTAVRMEMANSVKSMAKTAMASKASKVASALKGISRGRALAGLGQANTGDFQKAMEEAVTPDTINIAIPPASIGRAQRFGVDIAGQDWIDKDARKVGGGTARGPATIGVPRGFNPVNRYDQPIGIRAMSNTYASRQQNIGARLAGLGDAAKFSGQVNNLLNSFSNQSGFSNTPVITGNDTADFWLNIGQQIPAIMNGLGQVGSFLDNAARDMCLAGFPVDVVNQTLLCDRNKRIQLMATRFKERFGVDPKPGLLDPIADRFIDKASLIKAVNEMNYTPPRSGGGGGGGSVVDSVPGGGGTLALVGLALVGGFLAVRKK